MESIIGRTFEKEELQEAYDSKRAELIAIYGRRRIGKTYLIRNFFKAKKSVYFQITGVYQGALETQLARFAKAIGETFYYGATLQPPVSWMEAFEQLTKAIALVPKNKKVVVFFDELPWLATRKSGILSALEYFWNCYWSDDKRLKIIVCGSAASWIIKNIIKNRGGLHNRVTRKLRLLAFNLKETYGYLKHMGYAYNFQQCLKLYMVMGGIPFYLNNLKKSYSIDQNVDRLFFNSTGLFFNEFDEIFSSLFDNSKQYKDLVMLISKHKSGISRKMLDESGVLSGRGGRLSQRLEDLEDAGFITSYTPFAHKKLGTFYRISDEYCYFYLKWIEPIKAKLEQENTTAWKRVLNTPEYFGWLGYVFENVCYKNIVSIKKALYIDETALTSPWSYRPRKGSAELGAQIDLLFDRADNAITLCEIKYSDQPFVIDKKYSEILQQKVRVFKEKTRAKKQLFLALITANGVKNNMYAEALLNGSVKLEDFFK